ncbi:MAG: Asp-tRNA(Asn)/Glu-tRNA(Gln) amidotransferase subunit GatA [Armatimonadetes bacterium]|nr:Asp-tRNA(Asn)/Glu-tRNA(Gln) amidotransferase subunit GatA [Armatimonadota bacterium]MDW8122554.1 Asp-tRNA(Asn)/Glu-tRNA(Gln) amidotransferase subunit GatA [Armatimonadota bacterium]
MKLWQLTVQEAHRLLLKRDISSRELTESVLDRIAQVEDRVKAFITVTESVARQMAEEADRRLRQGEHVTPLTGIPIAIKDVLCTKGIRTTCGSRILENFVPPYDATCVKRLKEWGAVFVGKTNMDEFAMGSSTEFSAFFPTANPWDLKRVPGGSSGGSAAAVAAGECCAALGTDTGGSVRQPASFCGIVGLKPTYGRVSRFGLIAFASSLDQVGPMTRTVADCAVLLQAIAGHDPWDSTSIPEPVPDYLQELNKEVNGLTIGLPKEYFGEGVDQRIAQMIYGVAKKLETLGVRIEEVSLPTTEYALSAYYIIAPAEASSNLARYDGVQYGYRVPADDIVEMYCKTRKEGFGREVKHRIMLGTYTLSSGYYEAYYLRAAKVRSLIRRDFEKAFQTCQLLMSPTSPILPFPMGERTTDPLLMKMCDICTIPANMAGLPAISLPCGFIDGLPVGLQLTGPPLSEPLLLRGANWIEKQVGLFNCLAPLSVP